MAQKTNWILAGLAGLVGFTLLRKRGVFRFGKNANMNVTCVLAGRPTFANSTLNIPFNFVFSSPANAQISASVDAVSVYSKTNGIATATYTDKKCRIERGGQINEVIVPISYNRLVEEFGQNISAEILGGNFDNLIKSITITANITIGNYNIVYSQPVGKVQSWTLKALTPGVNGLGLCAASLRKIGKIDDYIAYLPPISELKHADKVVKASGTVQDTAAIMHAVIDKYKDDTAALAKWLKRGTLKDTLKSIFDFVYGYIQYVPDSRVVEQVRRPLRALYDQKGDCDCYATLIGSILTNLGIPYEFRIAAYQRDWQHVYVIVPNGSSYYVVDPVLDKCFMEKTPTKTLDL